MKKLIIVGLLTVGALGVIAPPSDAFFWFRWRKHGHGKFTTTITMRQYNAFTPVCWGKIMCDGCNPIGMNCSGWMPPMRHMPPWFGPGIGAHCMPHLGYAPYCAPPSCCTAGCCDAGCLPAPAAVAAQPTVVDPVVPNNPAPSVPGPAPKFTPPPPTPLPAISFHQMYPNAVQPVGYYPAYYPAYNYPAYGYPAYSYPTYTYPVANPWMNYGYPAYNYGPVMGYGR